MLDSQLARCATDWKGEKKVATWRAGTFTEMWEAGRNRFGRKARVQLGHIKFEMAWGLPWSCQVDTAPSSMLPYATTLLLVKSPGIHRARTYGWKGVCRDLTPRPIYIIYSLLSCILWNLLKLATFSKDCPPLPTFQNYLMNTLCYK